MSRFWIRIEVAFAVVLSGASLALGNPIEGFTEAFRQVELAPGEPGTLMSLNVREGDRVQKGQLVGSLDCDALLVAKQIAKLNMESHGRLDAAAAERDLRKSRLEKLQALRIKGHASQEEVNRASADADIAEANVLSAREQLAVDALEFKRAEALIERRTLRSPMDGIVTRIFHEEREYVMSSAPTVMTVVQLDPLRVVFSIPLAQSTKLAAGQTVPLTLPDLNLTTEGTIEFVSPVVDAESGTVRVKVLLPNAKGECRAGIRCGFGKEMPAPPEASADAAQ